MGVNSEKIKGEKDYLFYSNATAASVEQKRLRAKKIIYSILMPLLPRLNPRLDPTAPTKPIPNGTGMIQ